MKALPRLLVLCLGLCSVATGLLCAAGPAPKPLYRDPVYDGAADSVLTWDAAGKQWLMFYTNRRANVPGLSGVAWVHGTPIGIATSVDGGNTWTPSGNAKIEIPEEIGGKEPTYWAPEVVAGENGVHHMILTVVPGVFEDWKHPRTLVHLTSRDLRTWTKARVLRLSGDRLIDACLLRLDDGTWRLWYNNERDGKSIYYADSKDLETWIEGGKVVADQAGEGPKVFRWKGSYWMITDVWRGLAVYRSDDALKWMRQAGGNLVEQPGKGAEDGVVGRHADVVLNGDRAFLFYFTHPGHVIPKETRPPLEDRRSSIQVAELKFADGKLSCDRDASVTVELGTGR